MNYNYLNQYYKIIALRLTKQEELVADPKEIHQISFNENLDQLGNTAMFSIIEEAKETILGFSQRTVKVLQIYFVLI